MDNKIYISSWFNIGLISIEIYPVSFIKIRKFYLKIWEKKFPSMVISHDVIDAMDKIFHRFNIGYWRWISRVSFIRIFRPKI